ncbi:hypothetical protein POTOM_002437 [Populus tomentosa]|uniref:Uncharacterized protein n=1 Tax=Populus tomentosa TaxID=118781 RepID=A0A8X8DJL5_POPTO|nr:hypothetical protein POTOM_002437 [Populus tomentosa]
MSWSIIKLDDDLRKLFRGIELPRDMLDIEKYLQMNGMMPASNTAKRREAAQVKGIFSEKKIKNKKRGIRKIHNLANPHLPELYETSVLDTSEVDCSIVELRFIRRDALLSQGKLLHESSNEVDVDRL